LTLELSLKVLQRNDKVLRATIPQSPDESLLLRSLDPAFKVAPAQCLILGFVRQQNGAVVQRKTDLLPGQQIRKQTDASIPVRQWNDKSFLKPAANRSIDSLKAT
jgi:hypothetical protein